MSNNEDALLEALGEVTEQRKALEVKEKELRSALGTFFSAREGTGMVTSENFAFNYSMSAGRKTLDKKAMEEDGIDLDPYYKVGKPFMTLKISRLT